MCLEHGVAFDAGSVGSTEEKYMLDGLLGRVNGHLVQRALLSDFFQLDEVLEMTLYVNFNSQCTYTSEFSRLPCESDMHLHVTCTLHTPLFSLLEGGSSS